MSKTKPRPIAFQALAQSARDLAAALAESGISDDKLAETFELGLGVVCEQCGVRVGGREVYDLTTPTEDGAGSSARLERLRQGYCPRADCSSYYARLDCSEVPGVDWAKIWARVEVSHQGALAQEEDRATTEAAAQRRLTLWRFSGRAAVGLGVLLLLLLARQWYVGGSIPLLREPETFQVDPSSVHRTGPP